MKTRISVVPLALLLCTISFAQVAKNQQCSFEQAVSFYTATNLAESDYVTAVKDAMRTGNPVVLVQTIVRAFNSYKANIQHAADGLPLPCWRELVTAENSLAQCQQPVQTAFSAVAGRIPPIAQKYAQTGDRQAYESDMGGVVTDMLRQVPRQCWFQPITLPDQTDQAVCSQAWSEYSRCYQANQNVLTQGGTLQICYRPLCDLEAGNGTGGTRDCHQLWAAYRQCQEEFKRCTVRTHGTGPCPACSRPNNCPE